VANNFIFQLEVADGNRVATDAFDQTRAGLLRAFTVIQVS
jgi:hypothetical protein